MVISWPARPADLMLGGAVRAGLRLAAPGSVRDVLFQVAFGGYVGALFNLNPLLERDGYHVLVDLLREPGLRRRAIAGHLPRRRARPSRRRAAPAARLRDRLAGWSAADRRLRRGLVAALLPPSAALAPPALVWTVLAAFYLVLALPLAVTLLRPLWARATRVA